MLRFFLTVIISAVSLFAALPEGLTFTPYGMTQYRLRYEFTNKSTDDVSTSVGNYFNTIGYKVGLKANLNEQVSAQFEIGNDWGSTDKVDASLYNYPGTRKALNPIFTLAYAKWNPGYLHVEIGIIPVMGTSVLDILGISLVSGSYKKAAHVNWVSNTNNSMQGLRIGAPITKGNFKMGIDLMTSIIKQRTESTHDEFQSNNNAVMIMAELPMSVGGFSLAPQFITIPYKNYDKVSGEADNEFMGGLEGNLKVNDIVSFRAGFGFAIFRQNIVNDAASADFIVKKEVGTNGGVGTAIKIGPGKLDFEFRIGGYNDRVIDDNLTVYPFFDLKYGWAANKYFTIMPRIRMFITNESNDNVTIATRPELIFTGSF